MIKGKLPSVSAQPSADEPGLVGMLNATVAGVKLAIKPFFYIR